MTANKPTIIIIFWTVYLSHDDELEIDLVVQSFLLSSDFLKVNSLKVAKTFIRTSTLTVLLVVLSSTYDDLEIDLEL